ncbi:MAG: DUF3791 domain-containing protein [Fibrobacter sp.]|nr:DUF3791 domain-containing protein [Fibrobacter sp.]
MEGLPRTHESDVIQFAVLAIEGGAKVLGVEPSEFLNRLEKQGLVEKRLFEGYEMLHTQSKEYVADDIAETLVNWEND